MKVTINTKVLLTEGLTADEYLYLHALNLKSEPYLPSLIDLPKLQRLGFVKLYQGDVILRSKMERLFPPDVSEWIQEYRDLFKGTRDFKPMGVKLIVLKKMNDFIEENPEYSKQDIMDATTRYLNECKQAGIPNRQADYFIYKRIDVDGEQIKISDLLTALEETSAAAEGRSIVESINKKYESGGW